MRSLPLAFFLLVSAAAIQAQQPNTVSTTVSVNRLVTAGTATFDVQFLDASLNSTLDSALTLLSGAGASAANLVGVSVRLDQGFVVTQYDFSIVAGASEYTAVRDKLIAALRALGNSNTQAIGWNVTYSVTDEEAARTLEQALPGLLERAKTQATVLATAMGARLGKVSSIATPSLVRNGLSVAVTAAVTYLLE
jgi:uncharacterized protein YggE